MDRLATVGSDRLRIFQRRGNFSILGAKTTGLLEKLRRWSIRFVRDQEADVKAVIVGSRSIGAVDMDGALSRLGIDPSMVISGGARGVDRIAETWARARGIETRILKPDWRRYGRGAALKRNRELVEAGDVVVAFWDGTSRGTMHTVRTAEELGKRVHVVHVQTG